MRRSRFDSIKESLPYDAMIVALLFISFSPYLFFDFGFHNDFEVWAYNNKSCCSGHTETAVLIQFGRFLQGFLQNIYMWFFTDLRSLTFGRAFSMAFAAASAIYISIISRKNGMGKLSSAAFGTAIFLLPTAQINIGRTANFIPGLFAIIPTLCAISIFPDWKSLRNREHKTQIKLMASFLILLSVLFIYPPTVGFFLLPALVTIMYSGVKKSEVKAQVLYSFVFFGIVCFSYFLLHRFVAMNLFNIVNPPYGSLYRFDISTAMLINLKIFVRNILPMMLNLFNTVPSSVVAVIILILMVITVVFGLYKKYQASTLRLILADSVLFLFFWFLIFFSMNVPALVAVGQPPSIYRVWHPGAAAILLVLFRSIDFISIVPIRRFLIAGLLVVGCIFSFNTSMYMATTLSRQFEYAVEQVRTQFAPDKEFYIIVEVRPKALLLGRQRWGELKSLYILSGGHVGYILKKYFGIIAHPRVESLVAEQKENLFFLEPELHEKSNILKPPMSMRDAPTVKLVGIATHSGSSDPAFRLQRALDHIFYTFWELVTKFPLILNFSFNESRRIKCYAIESGEDKANYRMPQSWRLLGSKNSSSWTLLDSRDNEHWLPNDYEDRIYQISKSDKFKNYKIEFLSVNNDGDIFRIYEISLSEDSDCANTIP